MRTLSILTLTLLASLAVQDVAAAEITAPPIIKLDLIEHTVTDRDGDGIKEDTYTYASPACGCNCPVVGGGADIIAADQDHYIVAATSGCQHYFQVSIERGQANLLGQYSVDPFTIFYAGGLEPIFDDLSGVIATS